MYSLDAVFPNFTVRPDDDLQSKMSPESFDVMQSLTPIFGGHPIDTFPLDREFLVHPYEGGTYSPLHFVENGSQFKRVLGDYYIQSCRIPKGRNLFSNHCHQGIDYFDSSTDLQNQRKRVTGNLHCPVAIDSVYGQERLECTPQKQEVLSLHQAFVSLDKLDEIALLL